MGLIQIQTTTWNNEIFFQVQYNVCMCERAYKCTLCCLFCVRGSIICNFFYFLLTFAKVSEVVFLHRSTQHQQVQQCHLVDHLAGLKMWLWLADTQSPQHRTLQNLGYGMSVCNQAEYFPLVASQANYYFCVLKINNPNIL